jgi:hypothetical protein
LGDERMGLVARAAIDRKDLGGWSTRRHRARCPSRQSASREGLLGARRAKTQGAHIDMQRIGLVEAYRERDAVGEVTPPSTKRPRKRGAGMSLSICPAANQGKPAGFSPPDEPGAAAYLSRLADCARRQGSLAWELRPNDPRAPAVEHTGGAQRTGNHLRPVYKGMQTADLRAAKELLDQPARSDAATRGCAIKEPRRTRKAR